jgi:cell division protein FtsN
MIEPALATTTPAPEEDVTTTLYRAAIGPVSNGYYLPIFTRFEAADHAGISWNTAAALSTLNWLAFRHLWGAALAYFGALVAVVLLVFGIGRLVFQLSDVLLGALALGFGLAAFVLPGLFGNAVFHTDCRKRMSKALVAHSDVKEACAELTRQASTRKQAIILAAANVAFWALAGLIYLQLSALSNLTVMPQGALEAGHVTAGRAVDTAPAASSSVVPPTSAPATPASASASNPDVAKAAATASVPVEAASATVTPSVSQGVGSAPQAATSQAFAATARPSAPATVVAAERKMAIVDPVRQDTAKPQVATKPIAKDNHVQGANPQKPLPKAKSVKSEKSAKPVKDSKSYFVNVGLFAVAANAERAHAKLLDAQLPAHLTELKSSKGPQIRVRVGPFNSKPEAQAAVGKIKALSLDAIVVQP